MKLIDVDRGTYALVCVDKKTETFFVRYCLTKTGKPIAPPRRFDVMLDAVQYAAKVTLHYFPEGYLGCHGQLSDKNKKDVDWTRSRR